MSPNLKARLPIVLGQVKTTARPPPAGPPGAARRVAGGGVKNAPHPQPRSMGHYEGIKGLSRHILALRAAVFHGPLDPFFVSIPGVCEDRSCEKIKSSLKVFCYGSRTAKQGAPRS